MRLVINLDNTLFDATRYRKDTYRLLRPLGVSEQDFMRHYKQVLASGYSPSRLLDSLARDVRFDRRRGERRIGKMFGGVLNKGYLYPDAAWFLKESKSLMQKSILLTRGHRDFQGRKIEQYKLGKYFHETVCSAESRRDQIRRMIRGDRDWIFFVNNDGHDMADVRGLYPPVVPIQISRPNRHDPPPKGMDVPVFENLIGVLDYIKHYVT